MVRMNEVIRRFAHEGVDYEELGGSLGTCEGCVFLCSDSSCSRPMDDCGTEFSGCSDRASIYTLMEKQQKEDSYTVSISVDIKGLKEALQKEMDKLLPDIIQKFITVK
jgi:hypothetical protein